jgi:uncharacterized protein (DUF433 family)
MTLTVAGDAVPIRVDAGGVALVGDTRVPLDTVVYEFQDGAGPEEIVRRFDTLQLADVYAVIAYYLRHKADVDAYLEDRRRLAAEVRAEAERRFPPDEFRERLLKRRPAR